MKKEELKDFFNWLVDTDIIKSENIHIKHFKYIKLNDFDDKASGCFILKDFLNHYEDFKSIYVKRLEMMISDAIDNEEYEKAAEFRDNIKNIIKKIKIN